MHVLIRIIPDVCSPLALTFGPFESFDAAETWLKELNPWISTEGWWRKPTTTRKALTDTRFHVERIRHEATGLLFRIEFEMVERNVSDITAMNLLEQVVQALAPFAPAKK